MFSLSLFPDCSIHLYKTMLNTETFSATCSYLAKSGVMESLLKCVDKLWLGGAKLRLSQVV